MRLWTIHPKYLDSQGLVALWREGLLAQKVLQGKTRGYKHHPQLRRFQAQNDPLKSIAFYLKTVYEESIQRKYHFDSSRIPSVDRHPMMNETEGQLLYEWKHLKHKLKIRHPDLYRHYQAVERPDPHPLFRISPGPVQDWEKIKYEELI